MINLLNSISNVFTKFRIPTVLGLGIILIGTGAGVFLVSQPQNPFTQASKNTEPEEIIVSNIDDQSVTISWRTKDAVVGSVKYGISSFDEQRAVDDRDKANAGKTQERLEHYVTIKKLNPQTNYQYKIDSSGSLSQETYNFQTATSSVNKNNLPPLIGTVIYSGLPITEGIAYLNIPGATPQSAVITSLGNFTIPLVKVYNQERTDIFTVNPQTQAEIKIISPQGVSTAKLFLNNLQQPVGPLIIGQTLDLTNLPIPSPTPTAQQLLLQKMDLNPDGLINTADEAILKRNFGNNPQNKNADLDNNGKVDQEDLDLIRGNFNQKVILQ